VFLPSVIIINFSPLLYVYIHVYSKQAFCILHTNSVEKQLLLLANCDAKVMAIIFEKLKTKYIITFAAKRLKVDM